MPLYKITAKREIFYEIDVTANNQKDALDEVERIDNNEDIEEFVTDWQPLELLEIEEA
jgi:hypothetical protein